MTNTMAVVILVSFRVGQVTFLRSADLPEELNGADLCHLLS